MRRILSQTSTLPWMFLPFSSPFFFCSIKREEQKLSSILSFPLFPHDCFGLPSPLFSLLRARICLNLLIRFQPSAFNDFFPSFFLSRPVLPHFFLFPFPFFLFALSCKKVVRDSLFFSVRYSFYLLFFFFPLKSPGIMGTRDS